MISLLKFGYLNHFPGWIWSFLGNVGDIFSRSPSLNWSIFTFLGQLRDFIDFSVHLGIFLVSYYFQNSLSRL